MKLSDLKEEIEECMEKYGDMNIVFFIGDRVGPYHAEVNLVKLSDKNMEIFVA